MAKSYAKYIVGGAIGLVTITGAILYFQYKKLMEYAIKIVGGKVNAIDRNGIDVTLFLSVNNKSNLRLKLIKQKYDVYINDKLIAKAKSDLSETVEPKADTTISLDVSLKTKELLKTLGSEAINAVTKPETTVLKVDYKLIVSLMGIRLPINSTYETSLADLKNKEK